jgi:hypothetical protein
VFEDLPGERSPYFGTPNDKQDELWDQLYTGTGFLLFSPEDTGRMPNVSVAVPTPEGDGGIYGMEVFHELHCLVRTPHSSSRLSVNRHAQNTLRKTIYQEHYPGYELWYPNGTKNYNLEQHQCRFSHPPSNIKTNV